MHLHLHVINHLLKILTFAEFVCLNRFLVSAADFLHFDGRSPWPMWHHGERWASWSVVQPRIYRPMYIVSSSVIFELVVEVQCESLELPRLSVTSCTYTYSSIHSNNTCHSKHAMLGPWYLTNSKANKKLFK